MCPRKMRHNISVNPFSYLDLLRAMPVNPYDSAQFGFPDGSDIFDYPREARKVINEASCRIRGSQAFQRFWDRVLTDAEKGQLGGDLEVCFERNNHCVNLLCSLRDWIPELAIVEIAYQLEFFTVQRYSNLMSLVTGSGVGIESAADDSNDCPSWNRQTGYLEFRGLICREVRVARATSIVPVLDSFQESNWPRCVEHRVSSIDPQRIHDIVGSLNSNLQGIRFHVNEHQICWEPTTTR